MAPCGAAGALSVGATVMSNGSFPMADGRRERNARCRWCKATRRVIRKERKKCFSDPTTKSMWLV